MGISSGAAYWAVVEFASRSENAGKTSVTVFPDTGERRLSAAMVTECFFADAAMLCIDEGAVTSLRCG